MKFLKFPQAQGALQINTIEAATGKMKPGEMPFHLVDNPDGFCVVHVELSRPELQQIRDNGGKFFIIYGPGSQTPPIMQITVRDPFSFNKPNMRINGHEKTSEDSTGNDE